MKKRILFLLFLFVLIVPTIVNAKSGCCSYHGGVKSNGCGCNDGTSLSATCAPYYPSCNSKNNSNTTIYIKKTTTQDSYWGSLDAYMKSEKMKQDLVNFLVKNCKKDCSINEVKTDNIRGVEVNTGSGKYMMFSIKELISAYQMFSLAVVDRLETSDNYPPLLNLDNTLTQTYGNNFKTITNSYCQKYATKIDNICVCNNGYKLNQTRGYIANGDTCEIIVKTENKSAWTKFKGWFGF
ncbi:MAG: hypothetical protein WC884_04110 [Candidatus Paceibacterota bacterium]